MRAADRFPRRRGTARATWCGLLAVALLALGACGGDSDEPAAAKPGAAKTPLLFIFAGQSNMVGETTNASEVDVAAATEPTLIWNVVEGHWQPLLPASGKFGPELTALPDLARRLRRPVVAVKVALGATSLFHDWNPDRTDGLYAKLQETLRAATASPPPQGPPQVVGFFWAQGDTDGVYETTARAYQDNLDKFLRRVRLDLAAPTLPIVMAQIRGEYLSARPFGTTIRTAINAVAAASPNVRVVTADDLALSDGLHFTSDAMLTVGHRMAAAYMELERPLLDG